MPVYVIRDANSGSTAFCLINMGAGKARRRNRAQRLCGARVAAVARAIMWQKPSVYARRLAARRWAARRCAAVRWPRGQRRANTGSLCALWRAQALPFGAYEASVLERLEWIRDVLAPVLDG